MSGIGAAALALVTLALCAVLLARKIARGSSCCGTHEAADKKVRVRDRNRAHYPFAYTLAVDGMHCANCTRRVENALNGTDGVWARANLAAKTVTVLSKQPLDAQTVERTVAGAGYTVLDITEKSGAIPQGE